MINTWQVQKKMNNTDRKSKKLMKTDKINESMCPPLL